MSILSADVILLADDDETSRQLGRMVIEHIGLRVILAHNGFDALRVFHRHRRNIALLFLDVRMPGLGGIPLLEALRRIDPKVPALLTSSCEESELEQLSARFTFTDYAVKPWNHARVARQILASIARCPAPGARRSVGRTRLRS